MAKKRDPWADGDAVEASDGSGGNAGDSDSGQAAQPGTPGQASSRTRRGTRARFDSVSHAGRHLPVRRALDLPSGVPGEEPDEWIGGQSDRRRRRRTAAEVALRRGRSFREGRGSPGSAKGLSDGARREFDPWAEDAPAFGQREVDHALSPTPGTPPLGNLAVQQPAPAGRAADERGTDALVTLDEPLHAEVELVRCGRWTCGLIEKASAVGLEISLGYRGVGTRDFLSAGRRVRLLVSPPQRGRRKAVRPRHSLSDFLQTALPGRTSARPGRTSASPVEPENDVSRTTRPDGEGNAARTARPFQLHARILWVDPPSGPSGAVRAQLAVDTADSAALARWRGLVEAAKA